MRLAIFNGSPRGKASNSEIIISWLSEGLMKHDGMEISTQYLNKPKEHDRQVQTLSQSDGAILVFPLYTDAMPGLVMAFLEKLEPVRESLKGIKLGFVVHSGFPEALQSRQVERYLDWLAEELGAHYWGCAVMGGSEGIRIMPPSMNQKKKNQFVQLGQGLLPGDRFDPETIRAIAGKERMSKPALVGYGILSLTGLTDMYWISQLKKNNAYKDRFAKPYA